MGIKVANPPTQPALSFDNLQVDSYTVRVGRSAPYPYRVESSYDFYALDADGNRVYANKSFAVGSADFQQDFANYAINNGLATDVQDFITKVGAAKTQVANDYAAGNIDVFYLFAAFQLGIGMQMKILKGVDISGLI